MKHRHVMPFGTEMDDTGTRFRLWAPSAREVELELALADTRRTVPLIERGDGWYETTVRDAPAGSRYAYRIDGGMVVPDPASRFNPDDVQRASMVVDPLAYDWRDDGWIGRPWQEAIIYELHVGAFSASGTFAGMVERFDHLVELGVTAIELMPLADFPGRRNWGYDGVLPFAPDASYGTPRDLKRLVDAAHARGLMVFLDVVYNHFGPEGNYLHAYAPQFFNPSHHTPWGAAINFDGTDSRSVREFFIHNALYWLEEYRFDGLRFDAVDRLVDESSPDILAELATRVRATFGERRHVHLVLENDRNQARYLGRDARHRPIHATAQWNDDIHHAFHALITGESSGYYVDYADRPLWHVGRCLAEGFAYQGEVSRFRDSRTRGEPSVHLPLDAFVSFLQTHDQVGNRAWGERIGKLAPERAVHAAIACLLLSPSPPLLFMGEEFAASTPFLFFCDFGPELATAVREGRRREFARFARWSDDTTLTPPDPNSPDTFAASKLDWREPAQQPHCAWLAHYRRCIALRRAHIVPRLAGIPPSGSFEVDRDEVLYVNWTLGDRAELHLVANFSPEHAHTIEASSGDLIFATDEPAAQTNETVLRPYSVLVTLATGSP